MAVVCLVLGLAIGYLLLGSQSSLSPAHSVANAAVVFPAGHPAGGHVPSLQEMNQMAEKQAAPLLEKLKSDPNNSALLSQIAATYHSTHQFKQAATYYDKAVQADPKNVALRTRFAASLYRSGDADGAIAQLNRALSDDPHDANSLFNLGMIKLQGKRDGKGALAAWQKLLRSNPQLSADRKAEVLKRMADVQTMLADQHGIDKRSTEQ
jgi:cytochrome c-type biogenesis protein CcmH/NrfG